MKRLERGIAIAFEGIDASGKKTQSKKLLDYLQKSKNIDSELISFPVYTTKIGLEIKAFLSGKRPGYNLQVKHMLFVANRWEMKEKIEKLLAQGKILLLNRYISSGIAYGVANGLDFQWLESLEKGLPEPDLTLFLDIDPEVSFERKPRRKRDAFESNSAFLQRVRSVYLAMAEKETNWIKLNGSLAVEELHDIIARTVGKFFSLSNKTGF
jgi:dTMP kinase